MYSALEEVNALLPTAALNAKESDKNNVGVVGMKDGSIKLNAQTELKKHLAVLADNLLWDNSIDKKTDLEDYFLSVFVVASNDSSKRSDINTN